MLQVLQVMLGSLLFVLGIYLSYKEQRPWQYGAIPNLLCAFGAVLVGEAIGIWR